MSAWQSSQTTQPAPYRCLVLKASTIEGSSPVWIAGGDLQEIRELRTPEQGRKFAETMGRVCHGLQNLPIPVIVAMDGLVIGGAIEFALSADIRFCTKRSAFPFKQLEVGLATAFVSSRRLVATLGLSRAGDCLFRRRTLSPDEALDYGLVHAVSDDTEAMDALIQKTLKDMSVVQDRNWAVQKRMLNGPGMSEADFQAELDQFATLWMQPAQKTFLDAFAGKKK